MFDKLAKLEKIYRRNPQVPLFARLADLYLRRGKVLRALALCKEGCRRFPQYPTGYVVLSRCYQARGQFEEARAAVDQALRLDPQNPAGFLLLSRIYQRLGVTPLALKSLQQAASLDPFDEKLTEQVELLSGQALLKPAAAEVRTEIVEVADEPAAGLEDSFSQASPLLQEEPFAQMQPGPDDGPVEPVFAGQTEPAPGAPEELPQDGETELVIAPPQEDIAALLAEVENAAGVSAEPAVQHLAEAPGEPAPAPAAAPEPVAIGDLSSLEEAAQPVVSDPGPPAEEGAADRPSVVRSGRLGARDDGELIRLFQEIENQRQEGREASAEADPAAEEQDSRIATATLAEIYSSQGLVDRAIETYQQMLEQDPENEDARHRLAALEHGR